MISNHQNNVLVQIPIPELKAKLEEASGMPAASQRLIFQAKPLLDT